MSVAIVRGEDRSGFLERAARDPRLKVNDLGLLTRIVLTARGAMPVEKLGPEKWIRSRLQRLEVLGYCECGKTLSRPFECNGEKRRQRNVLCFTIDCDRGP